MRRFWMCVALIAFVGVAAIAAPKPLPSTLLSATLDPKLELENLTAQILAAKAAGQVPAPELYARYAELSPRTHAPRLDQANDNCPATIISSMPYTDSGTTEGMGNNFAGACIGGAAFDVIYQYTAAVTGIHTVSLCGSSYDTGLIITTGGSCPGETELACNDDFCSVSSQISTVLTAGQTYWFIVDGYSAYFGAYLLNVTAPALPTQGETCENPFLLSVPDRQTGATAGWTNNYDATCPYGGGTAPDVVYAYTPSVNQAVTFSLCESDYDTKLYIFDGSCTGTPMACNDDANPCPNSYGSYRSYLECVQLTAGHTYYVVVDGYNASYGSYVLTTAACQSGIVNDDCPNALPIIVNATSPTCGTTAGATRDCESDPIPEVWYTFTTEHPMNIAVAFCGTPGSVGVISQIFSGSCCGTGILISGNDFTSCSDGQHTLYYNNLAAGTYWMPVGLTPAGAYCVRVTGTVVDTFVCHAQDPQDGRVCITSGGAILDYQVLDVPFEVTPEYHITDLNLAVDIAHTYDADLTITLVSPSGATAHMCTSTGASGDNFSCTTFDDQAAQPVSAGMAPFRGSFIPMEALSIFNGENARGTWHLLISDCCGADQGTLNYACLTFGWDGILAAELRTFDALAGDNRITLSWSTVAETANDHFDILRDGQKVAERPAANNATGADYSWTDQTVSNGTSYQYTLVAVDVNGSRTELGNTSAVPSFDAAAVTEYALLQNYPNPFNPSTAIAFDLVQAGSVSLKVYNLMGQEVASLVKGSMESGRHVVSFNASSLSSGVYLYRLTVNGFAAEKKMLLMK